MTTQYGAPLTGEQMKLLRAAGLPDGTEYQFLGFSGEWVGSVTRSPRHHGYDKYRLPADHAAYTLLEKGWLDGRNVALWFGGDKAPDDLCRNSGVLLRWGPVINAFRELGWGHKGRDGDIIAYIRKTEGMTTHADRVLADAERMAKRMGGEIGPNELWKAFKNASSADHLSAGKETVTIAKMTRLGWSQWVAKEFGDESLNVMDTIDALGLIKPEPTREEQFWSTQPNVGAHVTDDVKAWVREALNFERSD